MSRRMMWLLAVLALGSGVTVVAGGTRARETARPEQRTVEEVLALWSPKLETVTDYQNLGGSPDHAPKVAVSCFRVVGPTVEELWNHYARLCGTKKKYSEKVFEVGGQTGPNGSYMLANRPSGDGKGGRGPSVFLLRTEAYTATVTFQPDPGGESISGSVSVILL